MESNAIIKSSRPAMGLLTSIIICILVLLVGVAGMVMLIRLKKPPAEAANGERSLRVEAIQIKKENFQVVITGHGEVKALTVVPIAPEVSGRIVDIHPRLKIGEIIPKGEVLFKIDPKDYLTILKTNRKRLKILKRSHELAKKEYQRFLVLFKKNNVATLSGLEAAEKKMLAAADQENQIIQVLETAENNLERCEVIAPFNARIKSVSLEKGQYVTPGQNVVTLADDSVLEIQVPIDSRDARKWLRFNKDETHGNTTWFSNLEQVSCKIRWTENNNGQTWDGHLHRIIKFDQQTRTLIVAVRLDTETALKKSPRSMPLVEGMFCSVQIAGRTLYNVFRLPRQAVSFENTVHITVKDRLKTVQVNVVRVDGENAYVAGGIKTGDMVVTTRLIDPLENTLLEITNRSQKENKS
ncbi:MAG: efflux RND transporter periplasmic adaptor subunit [Desulfobacteraceae bacterium]|nr:efflux RND transporter periplasmic adaptor subunit [Desulfobacteraceae bacterium]MDH3720312.1 efflux RND transporter periplasmic adaptor subunit [Desulfobacteraceae bacterium]MDH3835510.1 efflux RND transporter periplasmic adaptor subunit [Desulfobacteraceae bacterium]MDH3873733.1 efflux RND transporter periplasmic adaptor subunit [Desulfobacteraceae bacterium]MDH3880541.1 efflux RND transporter periplasmic adaptor subunit [Desulfobacteraceae bacterium]